MNTRTKTNPNPRGSYCETQLTRLNNRQPLESKSLQKCREKSLRCPLLHSPPCRLYTLSKAYLTVSSRLYRITTLCRPTAVSDIVKSQISHYILSPPHLAVISFHQTHVHIFPKSVHKVELKLICMEYCRYTQPSRILKRTWTAAESQLNTSIHRYMIFLFISTRVYRKLTPIWKAARIIKWTSETIYESWRS